MSGPQSRKKFWGKYRGTVVQNVDPDFRGRIICMVPKVLGQVPSSWCEACAPLSGPTGPPMGVYMVPPVGASVWVEFEDGDPEKPIWTGCQWAASSDVPPVAKLGNPLDPNIVLQSLLGHSITISDLLPPTPATGGIILKSASGAMIVVNDLGIFITTGPGQASITMTKKQIDFNLGALTILQ
jgi:Type VI secretion system/phage-baseplate injector OB domain